MNNEPFPQEVGLEIILFRIFEDLSFVKEHGGAEAEYNIRTNLKNTLEIFVRKLSNGVFRDFTSNNSRNVTELLNRLLLSSDFLISRLSKLLRQDR